MGETHITGRHILEWKHTALLSRHVTSESRACTCILLARLSLAESGVCSQSNLSETEF